MKRTLLLNSKGFPEKFKDVDCNPPNGLTKQTYAEKQIIKSINTYNPKLKITNVEYEDINSQFSVNVGKFMGLIVENKIQYENENKFENDGDNEFGRKIVIYVFLSNPKSGGRNTFCSQRIFPEIIDFMSIFLSSPSYTILNHPIYFINIVNEQITSDSILKQLASLWVMGIEYIEVFTETLNPKTVTSDIKEFVKTYEPNYKQGQSIFSFDYYSIDFSSKTLTVKTDKLQVGDHLTKNGSNLSFKGSYEKFYWMGILPMIILACHNGYNIDYSNLENFYNSNFKKFGDSEKIKRFNILLQYIKKLSLVR